MPKGTANSELSLDRLVASFRLATEAEMGLVRGALTPKGVLYRRLRYGVSKRVSDRPGFLSERERMAVELWLYMLAAACSMTWKEVAGVVGISPSAARLHVLKASDALAARDPVYVARYNGIRDRVRSCGWYAQQSEGRILFPQRWASRMHASLMGLRRVTGLPSEALALIEKGLATPWRGVEMVPPLDGPIPFEGEEAPPDHVDPSEAGDIVVSEASRE